MYFNLQEFLRTRQVMMSAGSKEEALVHFKPNLEMMFRDIDLDGDGIISLPEWKIYYKAMEIPNEADAEKSFKIIDLDGDDKMSLDEFISGAFDFLYNQEDSANKFFLGPLKEI